MLRRILSALTGRRPMQVPDFVLPTEATTTTTASGLQYEVVREGKGERPKATDNVTVHYAGWLTDGQPFDSSYGRGEPATFPLNGVIAGWTEGVQLMQPGSVYRFLIPSELGYGASGAPPMIAPHAQLVFQVELLKVG